MEPGRGACPAAGRREELEEEWILDPTPEGLSSTPLSPFPTSASNLEAGGGRGGRGGGKQSQEHGIEEGIDLFGSLLATRQ